MESCFIFIHHDGALVLVDAKLQRMTNLALGARHRKRRWYINQQSFHLQVLPSLPT